MTRLKENDIGWIGNAMEKYNFEVITKTGYTLAEIAAHAVGFHELDERKLLKSRNIAVIPISSGLGVIGGFSETVAAILAFLKMNAFVTRHTDVGGIAEAIDRNAEIFFLADDERFIAMHTKSGYYSDNSEATGKGYVAALDYMAGGLKGREVLILGAGRVGRAAAFSVVAFQGNVHIYDPNSKAGEKLAAAVYLRHKIRIKVEEDFHQALQNHQLIIDACPEGEFMNKEHLAADCYIAAPGVPLGIQAGAIPQIKSRLIHDPLQLGVATMLFDILKNAK